MHKLPPLTSIRAFEAAGLACVPVPVDEGGMQVQRLLVNNMRPVTPEDARNLYLKIL